MLCSSTHSDLCVFVHIGCCDLMPGFRFAAFYNAPNLVTLTSVWSRSLSLTMPLFVGIACINTQNVRLRIQFCNNDGVPFEPPLPEQKKKKTRIHIFVVNQNFLLAAHFRPLQSHLPPLKPNSFPQACLDGWMDGNPFLLV